MFLKPRKGTTDPRLRSLLQKAVRRGDARVAELTARQLDAAGDRTWLRSRAVVITFEECWPRAQSLNLSKEPETRVAALVEAATSVKQKDAAGLGALAYAFHEGDHGMLDVIPSDWALRVVSEALNRPEPFFAWAESRCQSAAATNIVVAARRYLAAATWAWDKACILAGAFLASSGEIPVCPIVTVTETNFQYWVALDKHTPQGKDILQTLGTELQIPYRQLIWAGFYFESAVVNSLLASPWWVAERTWRLRRAGLNAESGLALWTRVRGTLAERLRVDAENLRATVEKQVESQPGLF